MKFDYRISFLVAVVGAVAVYGVFSAPPLTSGGNRSATNMSEAEYVATISQERTFCQTYPTGIDCSCFTPKSVHIRTHDVRKVPGAVYANQTELARGQASRAC